MDKNVKIKLRIQVIFSKYGVKRPKIGEHYNTAFWSRRGDKTLRFNSSCSQDYLHSTSAGEERMATQFSSPLTLSAIPSKISKFHRQFSLSLCIYFYMNISHFCRILLIAILIFFFHVWLMYEWKMETHFGVLRFGICMEEMPLLNP